MLAAACGGETYTPEATLALTDSSRWRELEPLNAYKFRHGVEGIDGKLYFLTDQSIVAYDGYECVEVSFPKEIGERNIQQLFVAKNGLLYALSNQGLLTFQDGRWEMALRVPQQRSQIRKRFTSSPFGTEVVIVNENAYEIEGRGFKRIVQIPENIAEASFDRNNKLWIVLSNSNKLVSYQFDHSKLKLPIERKEYDLGTAEDEIYFPKLVASAHSEEVWSVNWISDKPASRYSEATDNWEHLDLSEIGGNNAHVNGFILPPGEFAIFTKTELLFFAKGRWHSLRYPEFDQPSNDPFHFIRRNGNLVIGGYGEKIYEVLYSKDHYESYTGLNYQCDGIDESRWFISVEGWIIENSPLYSTWTRHIENVIDTPLTIISSSDDTIWVAGAHKGKAALCHYDGRSWTRETHSSLGAFISHLSAHEMADGRIIFGSGHEDPTHNVGGVVIYHKSATGYESSTYTTPQFPQRPVGFAEIPGQGLWTGGPELNSIDNDLKGSFQTEPIFGQERWIDHIASDGRGNLWAALWERGLFMRNTQNEWIPYKAPYQIASEQVAYVLNDQIRPNSIWVATDKGISRFDGSRWLPFALAKGIRFSREGGTLRQSKEGSIWINLAARNWYFRRNPNFKVTKTLHNNFKTIRHNLDTNPPIVKITSPESNPVSPANLFVEWSSFDRWSHTPSADLKFSYKIDTDDWSPFASKNNTIFLDVPSGKHRIQVRAIDLDGNISAAAASLVSVIPPIWKRGWFVAISSLVFIAMLALIALLYKQRIRHIVKMEEFKLQFFTNISHELRTPLTVIIGPLESHLSRMSEGEDRRPLELAYKNARKTLSLIDQLLDFRSAQTNKISLNVAHADLVESIHESVELIRPLADEQAQVLEFSSNMEHCQAWFDSEKLERIVNNLVSNAIKYTPRNGNIFVRLSIAIEMDDIIMELIVEDNGMGIPTRKIDNIFEVFYRAGNSAKKRVRGSGIGLAYTRTLVESFSGEITVESPIAHTKSKKHGTRFTVQLPLRRHLAPIDSSNRTAELENPHVSQLNRKPRILIAEDDSDIREFIARELENECEIIMAEDGETALKHARSHFPDIIVSDIMMPQMDGKELCRKIKADSVTSHIPFIMLTALKSDAHQIEGLDQGADDYLSKPISIPILRKRIHNQLETLKSQHNRFQRLAQEPITASQELASNPLDDKLLKNAIAFIEEHIEDPMLDVESLALKMGMSRMTLYRKTRAIIGETPSQLIRSIRMKHAIEYLRSKEYTVSEVAYKIGFSDLSSFSTAFKKQYGRTPSEYTSS